MEMLVSSVQPFVPMPFCRQGRCAVVQFQDVSRYYSAKIFCVKLVKSNNSQVTSMDKLTVISGALFLAADVFAVVSLALPDWIISDVGGDTRLGLMWTCMTIHGRQRTCYTPSLQPDWMLTLICIIMGSICVTATIVLLAASHWDMHVVPYARWVGFAAMVLFCLAAVIFPMGFSMEDIGGEPYQLPSSYQVGISYIFFVLALWITVISELFAGKVCLPHF